ncbi:MAG: AI-2E family transporter [Thiotrichaceae bacterium]|nr:AI-2E family transporter [Thiotrichaceae bacterium]
MVKLLKTWVQRHFSDPQVIILAFLLILGAGVIFFLGNVMVPIFTALIIAYILDGSVSALHQRWGMNRMLAVLLTFSAFIILLMSTLFILLPLVVGQTSQFILHVPKMIENGQILLMQLPNKYPTLITEETVSTVMSVFASQVADFSQKIPSFSMEYATHFFTFLVYLIMVPLLVFFFLFDKKKMLKWLTRFLPQERALVSSVWQEVNIKSAGYIRGKFTEIMIVCFVSLITFLVLGLDYAMLLALMVGVSVLVPYVGAAVVAVPVGLVAYFQWGMAPSFFSVVVAYGVIQFLDGNILVPFLFSEMVNLHPAAIIAAVLIFGGLWGLWGVFFAIPLATLIHAVINSWPRQEQVSKS